MEYRRLIELINFLREDLAIPVPSLKFALRQVKQTPSMLPMALWQYGLVTLIQLEQIFDWLEQDSSV